MTMYAKAFHSMFLVFHLLRKQYQQREECQRENLAESFQVGHMKQHIKHSLERKYEQKAKDIAHFC